MLSTRTQASALKGFGISDVTRTRLLTELRVFWLPVKTELVGKDKEYSCSLF